MKSSNLDIGDKILFILGMTLCGVFVFVLVAGVIVALITSMNGNKHTETTNSGSKEGDEVSNDQKAAKFDDKRLE